MGRRTWKAGVALAGAATLAVTAIQAPAATAAPGRADYIIQLADAPVVAYDGGVPGLAATRPARGAKVDPGSAKVTRYVDHLTRKQDQALAKVGAPRTLYHYSWTFNGVAAELTPAQAAQLRKQPDVRAVTPSEKVSVDTSTTPSFLGLDAAGGLWSRLGGPTGTRQADGAGEDVVIGVIDTGIWPENPSFSDRDAAGKLAYRPLKGSRTRCVPGERFPASRCNAKLVGARYFTQGWGGDRALKALLPHEFLSARDYDGHGTHAAATAAGNAGVAATGPAAVYGTVSGVAPRARIAAYKALWHVEGAGIANGFTTDLVAAIDQAVADGVDVINYSVAGTRTDFTDPVQLAFLFAADAGVFVAASAGNTGPFSGTVAHPGPWVTTVAAGTHDRDGQGSVTLGNGATYHGASVASAVGPAPLIDAAAAALPGADEAQVALCYAAVNNAGTAVLDPAKVAGRIVVCDRGVTARIDKSLAVREAGGVGMILVNPSPNSLNADSHTLPTVHLQSTDRAVVKAYAATAGATATINRATIVRTAPAPFTAPFSARGPLEAGAGDLLKPDVMAPGQDVLAAVSPAAGGGDFGLLSGTSMAAPHVAGLAALLRDLHPTWSPMAIKSALMTSASDVLDGPATHPLVIFRQGAGHVRPNAAADPGLVFDAGANDWLAFLCGTTSAVGPATCAALQGLGYPTDPSDLNTASLAVGELTGRQTLARTVTNVGPATETYTASPSGLDGLTATVSPSTFTLPPGGRQKLEVTLTRTTAVADAWAGGHLTLTGDRGHIVRVPVVARPFALKAPTQVSGTGGGPLAYDVTFGFEGAFTTTARGLVPAVVTADTVADDPGDGTCSPASPNAKLVTVDLPAGTTYARFALFDGDVNAGSDLDLCVFRGTTPVGSSTSGTSAEEVSVVAPDAGSYTVVVHGWGVAGSTPFRLHTWVLGSADAANMTVSAPAAAELGRTGTVSLAFAGLAASTRYLGSVAYGGASGLPDPTIVRVDTP